MDIKRSDELEDNVGAKEVRSRQLEEFQSELDRRLASLDRGEGLDVETVFAEIRARSEERRRNRV